MNIKELTDDELSLAIGKAVLPDRDWTNASWNEFMPLAIKYAIAIIPLYDIRDGELTGKYRAEWYNFDYDIYVEHTNPLRALKECLLQVLQEVK